VKPNVAVIGLGHWGPNLARNISILDNADLHSLVDSDEATLTRLGERYPSARLYREIDPVLADDDVHAVMLATPPATHFDLARTAIEAGKHVFVEKPLALTSEHSQILIDLAEQKGLTLMVGHTFLYNEAVAVLKETISSEDFGKVLYIYSQRLNLGQIRSDVNVLWNLAPHDVSILVGLLDEEPHSVSARGYSFIQPDIQDVVYMNLDFPSGVTANVHLSWLDPRKVRQMTVVGANKMIVYDDTDPDAMIQVYDRGVSKVPLEEPIGSYETFEEFRLLLRSGDVDVPTIKMVEPLSRECAHFVECVINGSTPISDGHAGLQVARVLEAADRSLRNDGVKQRISQC
jgi:predicted dehydrogenase